MNRKVNSEALYGEWIHSREEDTRDEIVYRPVEYHFPPTRSPRNTFQFEPDGILKVGVPSPSDKIDERDASWELNDNIITILVEGRPVDIRQILYVEKGKLVFKKDI